MFPLNTILAWSINIIMNKKYDNNNIIIASRAYFLQWHRGDMTSWRYGAMLVRCWSSSTVWLHDLKVSFGCLHRQRSCGNVPAHSVFKGMNTVAIPLLFNYVDRSWALGLGIFLFSNSNPNTYLLEPACWHSKWSSPTYVTSDLTLSRIKNPSYMRLPCHAYLAHIVAPFAA
jgi:hypothetical protein